MKCDRLACGDPRRSVFAAQSDQARIVRESGKRLREEDLNVDNGDVRIEEDEKIPLATLAPSLRPRAAFRGRSS